MTSRTFVGSKRCARPSGLKGPTRRRIFLGTLVVLGASAFNDAGIFPGSEPSERVGLGVPGVNSMAEAGICAVANGQFTLAMITEHGLRRGDALSGVMVCGAVAGAFQRIGLRETFAAGSSFKYASQKANEAELIYPVQLRRAHGVWFPR